MRIPKWLYNQEKEIGIVYTDDGNGDIDAERALEGQNKFFIKSDTPEVIKPKTLVISDWSIEQYTKEQLKEFKNTIQELLLNNFTIYIWQDSTPNEDKIEIKKLNLQNLDLLDDPAVRFNVKPISNHDLTVRMKQKNVSADQLEILDYFNCKRLINDITTKQDSVKTNVLKIE